jgi:hypothetical protein
VVEEEAGVDGSSGDWQSATSTVVVATNKVESGRDIESGWDLESFGMKNRTIQGEILFIGSKISATVLF